MTQRLSSQMNNGMMHDRGMTDMVKLNSYRQIERDRLPFVDQRETSRYWMPHEEFMTWSSP